MIGWLQRLFGSAAPALSPAGVGDAARLAALHGVSFARGWSTDEFERLLLDRAVVADRALVRRRLVGFIMSRRALDEAEILSVAVAPAARGRGTAARLLDRHMRRLAGLGVRTILLEVDEANTPARRLYERAGFRSVGRRQGYYATPAGRSSALVLRRNLG